MAEVLAKTTFSSVIHNNEVCDEIVKWGNANGYPVTKAKLQNKLDAYVGFSPEYMILAKRLPPIPGGWDVTVESYEPEERIIPLNVKPEFLLQGCGWETFLRRIPWIEQFLS